MPQAKEAQVSKDMEDLRSREPDSPVFKYLEQVNFVLWAEAFAFYACIQSSGTSDL